MSKDTGILLKTMKIQQASSNFGEDICFWVEGVGFYAYIHRTSLCVVNALESYAASGNTPFLWSGKVSQAAQDCGVWYPRAECRLWRL